MSLIKLKHPIIFSFVPIKDYNTMIIKVDIFILSFGFNYVINALCFNESTIHKIYEDKGEYNLGYFLPKILLSFVLTNIFVILIKYNFLSDKDIINIKNETQSHISDILSQVKRRLIIKYIIFFVSGSLFLLLFWYYLSSFCAVYQNTQIYVIINTFITFFISLLYPFFINVIPGGIRIYSLREKDRQFFYRINYTYIFSII